MTFAKLAKLPVLTLLAAVMLLPGCASTKDDYQADGQSDEINDPIEPVNRVMYHINSGLDYAILGPASNLYADVMPDPLQDIVRNFFRNLEMPIIAMNKLLQGNFDGFGRAVGRFMVNTTAGVGGIVDIASYTALKYEPTDFGITLASWGVDPGFYLYLPIIGPSSLRDGLGRGVDYVADPFRTLADNNEIDGQYMIVSGLRYLDTRAAYDAAIRDTRKNSLDPYAAFRSLYAQSRAAAIQAQVGSGK